MQSSELNFLKEIDLLKTVVRQSLVHNGSRRENSAEHSWHLATAVFIMKEYAIAPLNLEKALSLAIFHDIVEIDAGDVFVYSDQSSKLEDEEKAIIRLMSILPQKTGNEIKSLWQEYESNTSYEANFVNALDRFLPIYSNFLNNGYSWKNHHISQSQVINRNKEKIIKGLPLLWDFVEMIMQKGITEGYLSV
jgi:putative hydrolase of HD superfamily